MGGAAVTRWSDLHGEHQRRLALSLRSAGLLTGREPASIQIIGGTPLADPFAVDSPLAAVLRDVAEVADCNPLQAEPVLAALQLWLGSWVHFHEGPDGDIRG